MLHIDLGMIMNMTMVLLCVCIEMHMGFLGGSDSKASAHNVGDPGLIP